jgi:predicted ATPase
MRPANWRNFQSVDVSLQGRAFVVGPNASGKSNFLDTFRFLHDLVTMGGGFTEAVTRRGGVSRLRCLFARQHPNIEICVEMLIDGNRVAYELHFSQDNNSNPVIKCERVDKNGANLFVRPTEEDRDDPKRLTQTFLEQMNVNKEYREIADFLDSVYYYHIVPQLIRDPDRYVG